MKKNDPAGPLLEACVETLEDALLAEKNGADRIELCADLSVGGITPPDELIRKAVEALRIPVMVMVRPRGGDFVCSPAELEEMKKSVDTCKELGAAGVVFGCLNPDQTVDEASTRALIDRAHPLLVTFHKAIDDTPDPVASAVLLASIAGIQRILSSGGAPTAQAGLEVLKAMIAATKHQLTILVAGKVTAESLPELHAALGAQEYHGRRIVA